MNFLLHLFGSKNDKVLKGFKPLLHKIQSYEPSLQPLSDEDLRNKTGFFRSRLDQGASLLDILPEAYAVCREAARRVLGQRHYDVQMLGGLVLYQGKIAEMKTGEGKTLTATLPAYLHGISGKGAHVVTVNDYLARRDGEWMGQIYRFLGLNLGIIAHGVGHGERQKAYAADITYGTNSEFGFDFLRDTMRVEASSLVQRGHHFVLVDEVDSILIDEARTPLIISGPAEGNLDFYKKVSDVIPGLQKDSDYLIDEKSRQISLTEDGINKLEKRLRIENLYDPRHVTWLHHAQQALKAHFLFRKDVDYVVRNGEIMIVDEFTGRLMPGRRYSDGLHGALEAKERVPIQQETQTLASISYQNYFRQYQIISGMTGTADTEAVEFKKIYGLDVVVIPTHQPMIRKDEEDQVYRTSREKFLAIAQEIAKVRETGQPILVGTASVEKSELISKLLHEMKIPHEVLNAKNHAREAQIIAEAGFKGRVTLATNMAGRGTDIKLGEGIADLGGLYVLGTERHEARRIDNQLRGRSGRQGDPGRSRFFLSLEDDLMRNFGSDRLVSIMERLGMKEGESIVAPMVSRGIEKAQKRVEERDFARRKYVLEYDDVLNQQRQIIYSRRMEALKGHGDVSFLFLVVEERLRGLVQSLSPEALHQEDWDKNQVLEAMEKLLHVNMFLSQEEAFPQTEEGFVHYGLACAQKAYEKKAASYGPEEMKRVESSVYLQTIDSEWKNHLLHMDGLREAVSLRGYGNRDPLQEYKKEAFAMFSALVKNIETETAMFLMHLPHLDDPRMQEMLKLSRDFLEEEEEETPQPLPPAKASPKRRKKGEIQCPCGSGKIYRECHGRS